MQLLPPDYQLTCGPPNELLGWTRWSRVPPLWQRVATERIRTPSPAVHEEADGWSHGSSVEKFTAVTVRFNLLSGVAAGDARADAPLGHRFNAWTSRKDYPQERST